MKKIKTRKLKTPAILLPLTLSPAFSGEFFQMMYMYAPFNKTYVMHVFSPQIKIIVITYSAFSK